MIRGSMQAHVGARTSRACRPATTPSMCAPATTTASGTIPARRCASRCCRTSIKPPGSRSCASARRSALAALLYRLRVGQLNRNAQRLENLVAERTRALAAAKEDAELADAGQVAFPCQHEPRDSHADERHHRHGRIDAGYAARSLATRLCRNDPRQRRLAARHSQRHSGFLEDRSRQARYRAPGIRCARPGRRCRRHHGVPGSGEESATDRARTQRCARDACSATRRVSVNVCSTSSATPSSSRSTARS